MKKLIFFVFIAIMAFNACKKADSADPGLQICWITPIDTAGIADGCISRVYLQPSQLLISAADNATISQLFQKNSMSTTGLQFYRYTYDACPTCATPGPYEYVRANQFFNAQLLFNGSMVFNFRQGVSYYTGGTKFSNIALDTLTSTKLQVLRKLFLNQTNHDGFMYSRNFKDSCMTAQFGYYDLNAGIKYPGNFIKAWKVIPKNSSYPVAYFYDDQLNSLVMYYNGIMTESGG
jgi:hypothetical protein